MTTQLSDNLEHEVGLTGALTIRGLDGLVDLRAVDGPAVRIHGAGSKPLSDDFQISRRDDALELTAIGSTILGIRWLGGRRCQPIDVEAPRGATITIETASGAIRSVGFGGDQRYQSVSGDIRIDLDAARTSVETTSGDVLLRATGRLISEVQSISGDVRITAGTLGAAQVRTTSGDIEIGGSFAGPGPYAIGTVSGHVKVASVGPVRVEGKTVAGDLGTNLPHRSSGRAGRRTMEIGDGGSLVAFQSISGDLEVVASPAPVSDAPSSPAMVAVPPAADPAGGSASSLHGRGADRPSDEGARVDDLRMQVLRDLESGQIAVAEADRRLADLDGAETPVERAPAHNADFAWVRRV